MIPDLLRSYSPKVFMVIKIICAPTERNKSTFQPALSQFVVKRG